MIRRERLERRLERRGEWAAKAHSRSAQAHESVRRIADAIPLGQPILVGHHSEKRARRDAERIRSGMGRAVAEAKLAQHHERKEAGLERQLESSIFDDDPDAIERLNEKISELETSCERLTRANKLWRKGGREAVAAEFGDNLVNAAAGVMGQGYSWIKSPFNLTSDRAEIRRCKQRISLIEARRQRSERATGAGGVTVEGDRWVVVTFAEKPERNVLAALRTAGFRWGQGSWQGPRDKLPTEVTSLEQKDKPECLCSNIDGYLCLACERAAPKADES